MRKHLFDQFMLKKYVILAIIASLLLLFFGCTEINTLKKSQGDINGPTSDVNIQGKHGKQGSQDKTDCSGQQSNIGSMGKTGSQDNFSITMVSLYPSAANFYFKLYYFASLTYYKRSRVKYG